ncbi:MAG: hypothetical protein R3F17_04980 [Planctomycetota bacterium]
MARPGGRRLRGCHDLVTPAFGGAGGKLTLEQHAVTGFALDGVHRLVADSGALDCARCHGPELAYDAGHLQRSACADCHEDPHGDGFDQGTLARVVADLAGTPREGCERCHSLEVDAWKPAPGFDHAVATGFFLKEKHAELDCELCHHTADKRPFGETLFPGAGAASTAATRIPTRVRLPRRGSAPWRPAAPIARVATTSATSSRSKTSTTTGPGTS